MTRNAHLIQMAGLCATEARMRHANALAALERFVETGGGIRYAKTAVRLYNESRHRALRAIEAVANCQDTI